MAVQYPSYRADPNAVPQINGAPGFISAVQKGYQLAQLPEQMKQEAILRRAQAQKAQVDAQYAEPEAQGRIAQQQAQTGYLGAQTTYQQKQTGRYDDVINSSLARDRALNASTYASAALTNTQNRAANYDLQQQQAIIEAIRQAQAAAQNGGQPQPAPQANTGYDAPQTAPAPQYQPGQGGAMYAPPQQNAPQVAPQGMLQPAPQASPQGAPGLPGTPQPQTGASPTAPVPSSEKVIQPGSKDRAYLDDLATNPLYAKYLERMGVSPPKTETKYNATSGQVITTTTWPSGKITANATQLTNGSNGIQVSTDEQGRPIVKIGGASSGRGQGGLGMDADGNLISLPTTATQTNLQQRSIGEQVAQPFLQDITKNLPQFQNIGKQGLTAAEGVLNKFGADFDAPSQKAKGEAAITLASEGLLKSFGLYGAHANIEEIKNTLQPKSGESVAGYKRRIIDYANTTIKNAQGATKNLAGIKVGANEAPKVDAAKVKHLTDNYSLEQLKQMQGAAQ